MAWTEWEHILPGDVFAKQWGKRQIVLIFLPPRPNSAKTPYIRVGGREESTWVTTRDGMETQNTRLGYEYIGRMPVALIPLAAKGRPVKEDQRMRYYKIQQDFPDRKPKPFYMQAESPSLLHRKLADRPGRDDWYRQQVNAISEAEYRRHTHPQLDI